MAGGNGALVEVCLISGHFGIGRCEGSPSRDTAGDPIDSETKCNARDLDPSNRGLSTITHVYSIMHMNQQPLPDNMNDLLVHQYPMWHLCSVPMNAGRRGGYVYQKITI
ncbi:hypothetical protein CY34DRAFT_808445 [Suillus luteus UH-Slu-Lm8-n1]|uniref:Uncharacterized protein n=1 Tax=Suillus luteus UH-Slu-Lm8-n1 TaxID=930992 RepID=A0A0D0AMG0_9AGAM|nr:hypothetical protein CY34DRAFT_808445 [Suillus luteus UH-Slu-Lm8-n1]